VISLRSFGSKKIFKSSVTSKNLDVLKSSRNYKE